MGAGIFYVCSVLFASPFLAMVGILAYYQVRRSVWKRKRTKGKRGAGFCPSSAALGAAFLFLSVLYRPSEEFVIKASLHEEVDEDDQGDPETPEKNFSRQLRRIRMGERLETLELRLRIPRSHPPRRTRPGAPANSRLRRA